VRQRRVFAQVEVPERTSGWKPKVVCTWNRRVPHWQYCSAVVEVTGTMVQAVPGSSSTTGHSENKSTCKLTQSSLGRIELLQFHPLFLVCDAPLPPSPRARGRAPVLQCPAGHPVHIGGARGRVPGGAVVPVATRGEPTALARVCQCCVGLGGRIPATTKACKTGSCTQCRQRPWRCAHNWH
jgi:hypothetical protein